MLNGWLDRKSTRLNSSHMSISYAVFCLKKKNSVITSSFHKLKHLGTLCLGFQSCFNTGRHSVSIQCFFPGLPFHRAEFPCLQSSNHAKRLIHRSTHVVVRYHQIADFAVGINDECSSERQTFVFQ